MTRTVELSVTVSYTPTVLKNTLDDHGRVVDQENVEPSADELDMMDKAIKDAISSGLENLLDDAIDYPGKKNFLLAHMDGHYDIAIKEAK